MYFQSLFSYYNLFQDDERPSIGSIPSDIAQSSDVGSSTAVVTWSAPSASDNSGTVNLTSSHSSGSTFSIGDTIVTYTAVDTSSNSANVTFTITVRGMSSMSFYWLWAILVN